VLNRLVIQNYRAIADLTLDLGGKNLLMGLNGAGKTSIFDVLAGIRELVVEGEKCENLFPLSSIPRWLRGDRPEAYEQRFEMDFEAPQGVICYELVIEQDEAQARSRVGSECLKIDDVPIFTFREGRVQLYRRNYAPGPEYTFDWNRSAVGSVLRPEIEQIAWFKERLRGIECVRIDAPRMAGRSEREEARPERDLSNFPSWYRRALIANTSAGASYLAAIREVIGGMDSLDLHELGQGIMVLRAAFNPPGPPSSPGGKRRRTFWLGFDELSDGQRALIGLYALLHFMVREDVTLCIDEPDNFVALAEIQPWLLGIQDRVDDIGAQVLIASHHPEMLDVLAPDYGIMLERDGSGPTTIRRYTPDAESDLSPAERVARGWERA
jgi:hypothetical protein